MPNFTTEDLLLYLYSEMNLNQKSEIENELQTNWALKEKFQVLREAKNRFEKIKQVSPRSETIEAILHHAGQVSGVIS